MWWKRRSWRRKRSSKSVWNEGRERDTQARTEDKLEKVQSIPRLPWRLGDRGSSLSQAVVYKKDGKQKKKTTLVYDVMWCDTQKHKSDIRSSHVYVIVIGDHFTLLFLLYYFYFDFRLSCFLVLVSGMNKVVCVSEK